MLNIASPLSGIRSPFGLRRSLMSRVRALDPVEIWAASNAASRFIDIAGTTLAGDGDPVGELAGLTGNGYDLNPATNPERPIHQTSGGLHFLRSDGNDDNLVGPAIPSATHHLFIAAKATTTPHYLCSMFASNTEFSTNTYQINAGTAGQFRWEINQSNMGSIVTDNSSNKIGETVIYDAQFDASTGIISSYINGSLWQSFSGWGGSLTSTGFRFFSSRDIGNYLGADLYGAALFSSIQGSTETAIVRQWLAQEAGMTL